MKNILTNKKSMENFPVTVLPLPGNQVFGRTLPPIKAKPAQ